MPKASIFCWLTLIFLISGELFGQRYFVRNFSAKQGLSQSEVGDMVQDHTGRLFITTAGSGVDVFDGVSFTQLGVDDGLVSPYIGQVFKDENGSIWFVSTKGLNLYGQDSIQSFFMDGDKLNIESVFGVEEIGERHFLIATDNGLVEFDNGTYEIYHSKAFERLRFFDVLTDQKGRTLLVTDEGLFEFTGSEVRRSSLGDGFPGEDLLAIQETSDGKILIGTRRGFYVVNEGAVTFVSLFEDEAYSVISFLESELGTIYAGTNGQGLFIQASGEDGHQNLNEENGLSDNYTWSLYEDMDANIWVGTSGAGLDLLSADHFQIFNPDGGLGNDIVYDIIERENGEIWFGIVQGGISVYNGEGYRSYGVKDGLSHLSVRCFLDEKDTLWIGTENGLTIYVDGVLKDVSERYKVSEYAIFDIHRTADGELWFACKGERYYGENGGVVRYRAGEVFHYTKEDGLSSNSVYCIYEQDNGSLLFGTTSGVSEWDGERFYPLPFVEHLHRHSTTLAMRNDHKDNLWIGAVGGLGLLRDGKYECLTDRDGLIGSTIYLLENQGDSILWIGSSAGLEKFDLKTFYEKDSIVSTLYNSYNGFFGTECNQNAVTKDSEGRFWFGTIRGAVRYDPSKDRTDTRAPRIEISKINKRGQETDWSSLGFQLDAQGLPVGAELKHDENSLQIEFIGVSLIDPDAIEYSFLLAGTGENWSGYQRERSVFYSNLPPGEYAFHVRSKNTASGLVSSASIFSFYILPTYYQTLWFRVLVISLLSLGMLGFFYWRIRGIRQHEAEEMKIQHRMAELEMTALRSQMNPHFLFNSLNSVNNFIIKNKKEEASEYLTKFSRLVRMVLQNSKEKLVSLENELTALRLYMQLESLRFKDQFNYVQDISSDVELNKYFIPPLLLQPYVENAIWHGLLHLEDKTGKLFLTIIAINKGIRITIEDNGVGREKAELFKSKTAIKNKSMGMKINSDRMVLSKDLYSFGIEVDLEDLKSDAGEPKGTRVTINITDNGK